LTHHLSRSSCIADLDDYDVEAAAVNQALGHDLWAMFFFNCCCITKSLTSTNFGCTWNQQLHFFVIFVHCSKKMNKM